MTFIDQLRQAWATQNSLLCVGLDTDPAKIPAHLRARPDAILAFNQAIVDATHDLVCAYKPQIAYYAAVGAEEPLRQTIAYIHARHPGIPVILDAKRNDIGSTADMYAREAFERYGADAVTVSPYMGSDTLKPFLDRKDKGVVVLCRTSNPGAVDLQDLVVNGKKLYLHVARLAATRWNANGNVLLVAGATYPRELGEIRRLVGDIPLLVPGVGAQGGDVAAVLDNGQTAAGTGLVINASRSVLYAAPDESFAGAARAETLRLRDAINRHRHGSAGPRSVP